MKIEAATYKAPLRPRFQFANGQKLESYTSTWWVLSLKVNH